MDNTKLAGIGLVVLIVLLVGIATMFAPHTGSDVELPDADPDDRVDRP